MNSPCPVLVKILTFPGILFFPENCGLLTCEFVSVCLVTTQRFVEVVQEAAGQT